MAKRKPKLECRRVQQVVMHFSVRIFQDELNRLLLDGWRVVPGTYYHTRVPRVADAGTPAKYIDRNGITYQDQHFVAIEREEVVDPEAARRIIEHAEGRDCPELAIKEAETL